MSTVNIPGARVRSEWRGQDTASGYYIVNHSLVCPVTIASVQLAVLDLSIGHQSTRETILWTPDWTRVYFSDKSYYGLPILTQIFTMRHWLQ